MQRNIQNVIKKAFLQKAVDEKKFNNFLDKLEILKSKLTANESEEFNKNLIRDFLKFEYDEINTYEKVDLAIYLSKNS